jgi:hypothetical protein
VTGAVVEPFEPITQSEKLARALAEKLKALAKYNSPQILYLGSSTPVQLVIQAEQPSAGLPGADGRSDLPPSPEIGFGGMPGEVREIRVRVANRVSAHLTGPKDMIEITPRIIDPFRYVTADAPISWIWDVRPLKTGQAQVVLDVFSHVKIGQEEGQAQFQVFRDTWKMEAEGLEWVKYRGS